MDFTRKGYLELFLDGVPVVATGRTSNRHTTLVEAGEHAEQHAIQIQKAGMYEVRVDGGLYYVIKVNSVILDSTVPPDPPPSPEGHIFLGSSSYQTEEQAFFQIAIQRTGSVNSVVDVDWAITNANASPNSGTVRLTNVMSVDLNILAGDVQSTEVGQLTLSNLRTISGGPNNILVTPFIASVTILAKPILLPIPNITVILGETYDMRQYIVDSANRRTATRLVGVGINNVSYNPLTELMTGILEGSDNNIQMELDY